jgi:hypothetical protein
MRRGLTWLLGFLLGTNGLWMLLSPEHWYRTIPGVTGTGPANLHFIRDIGCAYVVVGGSLFWLAFRQRQAWAAALAGGVFLTLHALVHLCDAVAGRESGHQFIADVPPVVLPALLVMWLVWLAARDSKHDRL